VITRGKTTARSHSRAVQQSDLRVGWYATLARMAVVERRRRTLDLLAFDDQPTRRRTGTWAERKAAARATVERLAVQAEMLSRGEDVPTGQPSPPPCAELEIEDYAALAAALAELPGGYKPSVKLSTRQRGQIERHAPQLVSCADE